MLDDESIDAEFAPEDSPSRPLDSTSGDSGYPVPAGTSTSALPEMPAPTGNDATSTTDMILTAEEAAIILGLSDRQVRNLAADSVIQGVKRRGMWELSETSVRDYQQKRETAERPAAVGSDNSSGARGAEAVAITRLVNLADLAGAAIDQISKRVDRTETDMDRLHDRVADLSETAEEVARLDQAIKSTSEELANLTMSDQAREDRLRILAESDRNREEAIAQFEEVLKQQTDTIHSQREHLKTLEEEIHEMRKSAERKSWWRRLWST